MSRILDEVTAPKLFECYVQSLEFADEQLIIYILQTLFILYKYKDGRFHILKN